MTRDLEALYGPAGADAIRYFRRPRMGDARFALLRKPTDPHCKPVACATLAELAALIHRDRKGQTLHTFDAKVAVQDEEAPRAFVSLFAVTEDERPRHLGLAYLDGRGAQALRGALEAVCPQTLTIRKAA
jgi:hypothetical protein